LLARFYERLGDHAVNLARRIEALDGACASHLRPVGGPLVCSDQEMDSPALPDAPSWFTQALAVPSEDIEFEVDGARIHAVTWGRTGTRGLVFVHGGGAHAHWWTHVAARFSDDFRVVAVDCRARRQCAPLRVLARALDRGGRGGRRGWRIMAHLSSSGTAWRLRHHRDGRRHAELVTGAIICDSPVTEPDPEIGAFHLREAFGRPRIYPTVDDAVTHFRTVPEQDHYLDYVVDFVARHSLRAVDGGWQWKFDRQIFAQFGGGYGASPSPYSHRCAADSRCCAPSMAS